MLPNEKSLLESDGKKLVLTTHRVRYKGTMPGGESIVSIMLDELSSIAYVRRSNPILMVISALFLVSPLLVNYSGDLSSVVVLPWIAAAVCAVAYVYSGRPVLELASAGATIQVNTRGMTMQTLTEFIDQVEEAKNARYLLAQQNARTDL